MGKPMASRKAQKPKEPTYPPVSVGFEDFVRAAMATGKPPAQKKKAAKRRPRKGGK